MTSNDRQHLQGGEQSGRVIPPEILPACEFDGIDGEMVMITIVLIGWMITAVALCVII